MKILLATDGSGHGEAAVDAIIHGHYPAGSAVRIISVVEPPYFPPTTLSGGETKLYEQMNDDARAMASAAVEQAADALRAGAESRALNITTAVLNGSPKQVILDDADAFGADLIVVGSHGHGMLERFLLGSVSQAVALHAKCSVEIVRSPTTHARVTTH